MVKRRRRGHASPPARAAPQPATFHPQARRLGVRAEGAEQCVAGFATRTRHRGELVKAWFAKGRQSAATAASCGPPVALRCFPKLSGTLPTTVDRHWFHHLATSRTPEPILEGIRGGFGRRRSLRAGPDGSAERQDDVSRDFQRHHHRHTPEVQCRGCMQPAFRPRNGRRGRRNTKDVSGTRTGIPVAAAGPGVRRGCNGCKVSRCRQHKLALCHKPSHPSPPHSQTSIDPVATLHSQHNHFTASFLLIFMGDPPGVSDDIWVSTCPVTLGE